MGPKIKQKGLEKQMTGSLEESGLFTAQNEPGFA